MAAQSALAICAAAFVLGPAVLANSLPRHQPVSIHATGPELLSLADQLLQKGHRDEAVRILDVLSSDPDIATRNEARLRRSKLLEAEGSVTEAALLLRRILEEMPDATAVRLDLAQVLDRMGDKEGAFRQARAAARARGIPPEVVRIIDRYSEALRAVKPAGASFEIAIAPDSNISRATRSETLGTILGDFRIDENSRAQSGTGLALQGQIFRRLPLGADKTLLARATTVADLYPKSRFNDVAVDIALGPELQWGSNRLTLEAGGTEHWYGQKPFQRSARLGLTWTHALGSLTQIRLVGLAGPVDNQVNDLEDGKTFFGEVNLERALSTSAGVALTLGSGRNSLKDPGYSTRSWNAGLIGWRDIGRATVTTEAQFGRLRADDRLILFPDKRSEQYIRFTIGMTMRQLTFRGFAPVTRVIFERNRSTIEFYDYRRVRTEVGVTRAF